MAIRQLKSGKAAGPGKISAQALKVDLEKTVDFLYPLHENLGGRANPNRMERRLLYQAP